ncbi:hypothetical protein MGWOODY_Clf1734 [hydrothermal vent metagenome]|uniref:Uncharacterized protein n=1 Tax=hydrothermal vent metagenome TaxID=652676 RepID=A0A161JVC3_9ZZZZ
MGGCRQGIWRRGLGGGKGPRRYDGEQPAPENRGLPDEEAKNYHFVLDSE